MLLHVGNHYQVKGHDALLRMFSSLRAVDATLVIIGGPPRGGRSCWETCQRAAARDGRVRLLSGLCRREVVAAYREADVVLLTSRFEVAPLTLVEAMAAGVPFVSYNVGNATELAGGLVVNTAEEMARILRDLLEDHDRRRRLGEEGRQAHRHMFEWERIIDRYEEFYSRVWATARSSRGIR
ncbi:MAG: glycosyltransferase family 4 protein [Armatimonadota bacterium]|nr:glycosyltransferase family 4 protein [Armatimonadota bacterium]